MAHNCPDCARVLTRHCADKGCDLWKCENCCRFGRPKSNPIGPQRWAPAIDQQAERKAAWKFWRDQAT